MEEADLTREGGKQKENLGFDDSSKFQSFIFMVATDPSILLPVAVCHPAE
jgi:hypothetical protein